jgi:hypothetical protein
MRLTYKLTIDLISSRCHSQTEVSTAVKLNRVVKGVAMYGFQLFVEGVDLDKRYILKTTCLFIKDLEFS